MNVDRTIEIAVSPEDLWPLLTDTEHLKTWMPDIVDDELLTSGPVGPGTTSRTKIREGRKIVDYITELKVYEPPTRLDIELREGSLGKCPMRVSYQMTRTPRGTRLRYTGSWRPIGFALRLMYPLLLILGRNHVRDSLRRLKSLAESPAA